MDLLYIMFYKGLLMETVLVQMTFFGIGILTSLNTIALGLLPSWGASLRLTTLRV